MSDLPSQEELQKIFPKLEIQYLAGRGGMGAVYRVIQQPLERTVALKILPPEFAKDKLRKVRFGIEARAMARLSHPNLVQLFDFGESGGISWMIQEWVEGKTLFQIETEGGLVAEEAAALVCQVGAGLQHAHSNGVIHRDVKPANILMNQEGQMKLTDFGLARAVKGGANSLISTMDNCRYGTAEYAAPEVWDEGAEIDHKADIFSLGVLLYEVLTGKRPSGVFEMPSEVKHGLDPRFDGIIIRAMQASPENRYQDCKEFTAAIRAVLDVPSTATLNAHPHTPSGQTNKLLNTAPQVVHSPLNTQPVTLKATASIPNITSPVAVRSVQPIPVAKSSSGIVGKLVMIVVLIAVVGFVWKISQDKIKKVDEQHDRADARLAKELESRNEIKEQIRKEKEARLATPKTNISSPSRLDSTTLHTKKESPEVTENETKPSSTNIPIETVSKDNETVLWRRDWKSNGHDLLFEPIGNHTSPRSDSVEIGPHDLTLVKGTVRTFETKKKEEASVGGYDIIGKDETGTFEAAIEMKSIVYTSNMEYTLNFIIGTGSWENRKGNWFLEFGTISDNRFIPFSTTTSGSASFESGLITLNEKENFNDNTNYQTIFGYKVGGRLQTLQFAPPSSVVGKNIAFRFGVTHSETFAGFSDMVLTANNTSTIAQSLPLLASLDKQLRERAKKPLATYTTEVKTLKEKYTNECIKQDEIATNEGQLDSLLFWQEEQQRLNQGVIPREYENIPSRAVYLRTAWHNRIDKVMIPLLELQQTYLKECDKIEASLLKQKNNTEAETIKLHSKRCSQLSMFIQFCRDKK